MRKLTLTNNNSNVQNIIYTIQFGGEEHQGSWDMDAPIEISVPDGFDDVIMIHLMVMAKGMDAIVGKWGSLLWIENAEWARTSGISITYPSENECVISIGGGS